MNEPVRAGETYRLEDFQQRVGLTRHGLRAARSAGLRVVYIHGRGFINGSDWLEYLDRSGKATKDAPRREVTDA